jgi:hypothetical protein
MRQITAAEVLNFILAIATAILAYFTYLLWKETHISAIESGTSTEISRQALNSERRAWIAPLGAYLQEPIDFSRPIDIEVSYENTGQEPAVIPDGYRPQLRTDVFSGGFKEFNRSPVKSHTCIQPAITTNGLIVYPRQTRPYTNSTTLPPNTLDQKILDGTSTLFITGCVSYVTLGEIHSSAYCFYLRPSKGEEIDRQAFFTCASGNRTD